MGASWFVSGCGISFVVELVALRRVAPRRAAQRLTGAPYSVRSTRTGLSQRDKHHIGASLRARRISRIFTEPLWLFVVTSGVHPSAASPQKASSMRRPLVLLAGAQLLLAVIGVTLFVVLKERRKAPRSDPQIIATFSADYVEGKPTNNWRYLWNPIGPIGHASNYVDMAWNGSTYAAFEIPQRPQPLPAHYLRIARGSGHPGQGYGQGHEVGNAEERFAIIGYSVREAGHYWLTNSVVARQADLKNGSLHVRVFVNDNEMGQPTECRTRNGVPFDRALGALSNGDTVYVAVGPHEVDVNDGFDIDFSIAR